MREALYFDKLGNNAVQCRLCPHNCVLEDGRLSDCMSRKNIGNVLYALNYSQTISLNLDPIEKKPLYHYYPGSMILSLGANSCNLHCEFCQNYTISQDKNSTTGLTAELLLSVLRKEKQQQVAFTYTEPFTWYEFILDFARISTQDNIRIVLITNGYINPEPLQELLPYVDAMNIDLKGMSEDFYHTVCGGTLAPVLETIKTVYSQCHIEITNLLIPGLNDDEEMINALVDFVAGIDNNIPLHFSRYFPKYKCDKPPTRSKTLDSAYLIARQKLSNVYLGNVEASPKSNTCCSRCGALLIDRTGYHIKKTNLVDNHCGLCQEPLYGKY